MLSEPYLYKVGSKEAGQQWTGLSEKLNTYFLFKDTHRDQRSVREQFNRLIGDYKKKKQKIEQASGIECSPPTENENMLENIIEVMNSTPLHVDNSNTKKEDKRRKDAIACRDKAMTTWAKAGKSNGTNSDSDDESDDEKKPRRRKRKRKSTSDAFQFLAEKAAKDSEIRKEELELKRKELEIQEQWQKDQFTIQKEQLKQTIQNQENTQNLVLALIQKMSK